MEITMASRIASTDATAHARVRVAAATSIGTSRLADTFGRNAVRRYAVEPKGEYRLAPVFVRSTGDVCPLTGAMGAVDATVTDFPGSQSWGPPV